MPVKPLAILFRAKLRAALRQTELYRQVGADTWRQAWVVDCRPVGSGVAALKYLAPYIFHVALSNNRIVGVQDNRVTFRYRDGATKQVRTSTLPALTFLGRFLQHVLPKGFVKMRYYDLFSRQQRAVLAHLRQRLLLTTSSAVASVASPPTTPVPAAPMVKNCRVCGQPMQASVLHSVRSRGSPAAPRGGRIGNIPRRAAVHVVWPLGRGVPQVVRRPTSLKIHRVACQNPQRWASTAGSVHEVWYMTRGVSAG